MKRLFSIKDTGNNTILAQDYPNKMEAKAKRDKLNGGKWDAEKASHRYVVVLGPDHNRYEKERANGR